MRKRYTKQQARDFEWLHDRLYEKFFKYQESHPEVAIVFQEAAMCMEENDFRDESK